MKSSVLWTLTTLSLASAIELAPRSSNPRVVGLDIERRSVPDIVAHDKARLARRLTRRQNTVEEVLDNEDLLYFANLTLGTPAQSLRMSIDTGSSDLWVNEANSTLCAQRSNPCIGGTYSPTDSSTYRFVNSEFNITYVDGSGARGNYVNDTLGFGGVQLQNFQFGIGQTSASAQGVLGIGYASNEVQVQRSTDGAYPNLPLALRNQGHINRPAYSLWLNDLDASTGSILFGGVNRAKYQGNLQTVPIFREAGRYYEFVIAMTSFGLNGSAITSGNLPSPVVLDSGSTISRLPDDIVEVLYDQLGIQYEASQGIGVGYCDLRNTNAYLEFGFSGVNIQVPFNELFLDLTDESGNAETFQNGQAACLFGISPSGGIIPILGDTFLRSAYVVYDLEANEISLAQTIFNATANDIVEIASGTGAVPGATPAPTIVNSLVAGTATGGAVLGTQTGSFTALNGAPTSAGTLATSGTLTAGSSASSRTGSSATLTAGSSASSGSKNAAYATQIPSYLAGAAMVAGAGLLI